MSSYTEIDQVAKKYSKQYEWL